MFRTAPELLILLAQYISTANTEAESLNIKCFSEGHGYVAIVSLELAVIAAIDRFSTPDHVADQKETSTAVQS